jgi:SAM-dependent methyltransferase
MDKPSIDIDPGRDPGRHAISMFVRRAAARAAAGDRVLDAGAGESIYRPLFEGRSYVAVDRGVGDAGWNYKGLEAVADLEQLPFGGGVFHLVLCTETLEHVARPAAVLRELRRVLRSGGTLALSVPFLMPVHQEPHDYFRYTPHGLRRLLVDAGFEVEEISAAGGYFTFLHRELLDFPSYLPLGLGASPTSWLSWPFRAALRIGVAVLRLAIGFLRRLDAPHARPIQYFALARTTSSSASSEPARHP